MYSKFLVSTILITSNVASDVIPKKKACISHNSPKNQTKDPSVSEILYCIGYKGRHIDYFNRQEIYINP